MRAFLNQPVEPHTGVIECMIRRKKGVMTTVYQAFYEVSKVKPCSLYWLLTASWRRQRNRWDPIIILCFAFDPALLRMCKTHLYDEYVIRVWGHASFLFGCSNGVFLFVLCFGSRR